MPLRKSATGRRSYAATLALCLLAGLSAPLLLSAQSGKGEPKAALQAAQAALEDKNYTEALLRINQAREKVLAKAGEALSQALPDGIQPYKAASQEQADRFGLRDYGAESELSAQRSYLNPGDIPQKPGTAAGGEGGETEEPSDEAYQQYEEAMEAMPRIQAVIQAGGEGSAEVAQYHAQQMQGNTSPDRAEGHRKEALRIKDYRALYRMEQDERNKRQRLLVVVGGGMLKITARGDVAQATLIALAEQTDFQRIKQVLGE
jgi:hypothetical protein